MLKEQRTYSISQVAETLGVSSSWLRLGERLGLLPRVQRTEGGHRRYAEEDIERLRQLGVGRRKRALAERSDD